MKIAAILLSLVSSLACAQSTQFVACPETGCTFVADIPAYDTATTVPAICGLSSEGQNVVTTEVVNGSAITPSQGAGKFCYFPNVVLPAGHYSLTVTWTALDGRISAPSLPLDLTIIGPLDAPVNLRVLEATP